MLGKTPTAANWTSRNGNGEKSDIIMHESLNRSMHFALKRPTVTNSDAGSERLLARHTPEGGHRTMDILHVATALSMGVREFLSFDGNQTRLASAEGLE